MSAFIDIDKTLRKALDDLGLLDNLGGSLELIGENTNFNPETDLGAGVELWAETFQLPIANASIGKKTSGDADENAGIFQVSLFTNNTNDGSTTITTLADLVSSGFIHGTTFTDFEDVFIESTSRSNGRIEGAFFQVDLSINWTSYITRS